VEKIPTVSCAFWCGEFIDHPVTKCPKREKGEKLISLTECEKCQYHKGTWEDTEGAKELEMGPPDIYVLCAFKKLDNSFSNVTKEGHAPRPEGRGLP